MVICLFWSMDFFFKDTDFLEPTHTRPRTHARLPTRKHDVIYKMYHNASRGLSHSHRQYLINRWKFTKLPNPLSCPHAALICHREGNGSEVWYLSLPCPCFLVSVSFNNSVTCCVVLRADEENFLTDTKCRVFLVVCLQQLYQTFNDYDIRFYIYEVLKVCDCFACSKSYCTFVIFTEYCFLGIRFINRSSRG